jgi:hypothetical protein
VRLRNIDGRTLKAAVRVDEVIHVESSSRRKPAPTKSGATSPGTTTERQPNDKSDSVAN